MPTAENRAGPVPLYLIPQAISAEIHKLKDRITEIHIRRTSGHNYAITIHHDDQEEADHAE